MNKPKLTAGRPSAVARARALDELMDRSSEKKRVNFEVSADDHLRLKMYAIKSGKTVTEVLTDFIRSLPE